MNSKPLKIIREERRFINVLAVTVGLFGLVLFQLAFNLYSDFHLVRVACLAAIYGSIAIAAAIYAWKIRSNMAAKTRTFVFGLMSVGLSGVVVLSLMVTPYLWDLSPIHPKA